MTFNINSTDSVTHTFHELSAKRELVFIDAEYTGEHSQTTLVSLGLVTMGGEELYLTLDDYDQDQVTDWLKENVLSMIDPKGRVNSQTAYEILNKWLKSLAGDGRISLVSAGLGSDLLLLFELYKYSHPNLKYFHALQCLPLYLNHVEHFDLNTLYFLAGKDPSTYRDQFVNSSAQSERHNALYDANLARKSFLKLLDEGLLSGFEKLLF